MFIKVNFEIQYVFRERERATNMKFDDVPLESHCLFSMANMCKQIGPHLRYMGLMWALCSFLDSCILCGTYMTRLGVKNEHQKDKCRDELN